MGDMGIRKMVNEGVIDSARLKRELKTVEAMLRIFCFNRHGGTRDLCRECAELLEFVRLRIDRCPFAEGKPTCANCRVHCFKPAMRERIKDVMRFSGPRMPRHHPILSLMHFIDGRRPTPTLERVNRKPGKTNHES
jgi:hypothetical protein